MAKYRKWLGYILFSVIVGGIFLYCCFPSKALREYLEGSAGRFDPQLALRIHRIRPMLPFGLKLVNTEVTLKEKPRISLFKADSFVVMPSLRVLMLRGSAFSFDCSAYGGKIQGVIAFKTYSLGGPFVSDIQITGVRLGEYPFLRELLKRELTGAMSGTVTYTCSQGNFLQGSGKGDLSVSNGSVRFARPFWGVESVDFQRLDAQIVLEKQRISLARFDFKGKQMEGKVSGTIHLNPNLPKSSLDLTVAVKSFPSFFRDKAGFFDAAKLFVERLKDGNFKITIRGTVAQPRINFI